jgi:hypothetical protein
MNNIWPYEKSSTGPPNEDFFRFEPLAIAEILPLCDVNSVTI